VKRSRFIKDSSFPLKHLCLLALLALGVAQLTSTTLTTNAGTPGSVIINELMYDPGSGNQDDEFLELYNTTGSSIDLEGWCFSDGITLVTAYVDPTCFPAGTSIAANGYLIVSPNASQTNTTYGLTPSAVYTGTNLSNGGETITLVDETDQVIDTVTYDDAPPWPLSPDGDGPSLELKDPNLDNSLPSSWGASVGGPTPMAENSWLSLNFPTITSVSNPNNITDADTVTITANVVDATSVNLIYKVMFGADVTIPMLDDGNSGDGAAGDNVYAASIPAQAAGELVRFRVEATNLDGTWSSPSPEDSKSYEGYVVDDPSVVSNAPIIQWFMDDADYNSMITDHVYDNFYLPAVIAYGDQVWDRSVVRVRGEVSRELDKKPFKFKLPSGYKIDMAGGETLPIGEFNILTNQATPFTAMLPVAWWVVEQSGLPVPADFQTVRVQKNNEFHGVFYYADKYDKEWQEAKGYSEGELYEDSFKVVNGASDYSRVVQLLDTIAASDEYSQELVDLVLDDYDIPKLLNFMSAVGVLGAWDQSAFSNSLQYYDKERGRWSALIWDIDGVFATGQTARVSPYNWRNEGQIKESNYLFNPVYFPDSLKELYKRRLRTLVDKVYTNNQIDARLDELNDPYLADQELDNIKWPKSNPWYTVENLKNTSFFQARRLFNVYLDEGFGLPKSQTDAEREQVYIEEAIYNADTANEYIKISNNANTAVDISNWTIEGIDYEIPAGAVVPANGSIYILRNDMGYKAANNPVLVAGQYSNSLNALGGQLTLRTDLGVEIDVHNY
jgi:hypothetical protein